MTAPTTASRLAQALALIDAGRHTDAKAMLLRIVKQSPRDARTLAVTVATTAALGELDTALYYAARAVEVTTRSAQALANRARVHLLAQRTGPAIDDLRAVLAADPRDDATRAILAQTLEAADRLPEALALLDEASDRLAASPRLRECRANALLASGRADEALDICRELVAQRPDDPTLAARAASVALYAARTSLEEIKQFASRYGRLVSVSTPVSRQPFDNIRDPDKRLRIGFVGGDFRSHAVMRFFEPLLDARDPDRLEFRCYMTMPGEDDVTARIRGRADHFRSVARTPRAQLAPLLRAEQLDIAIDLSGHTVGHRVECFHHRVAPLQLTWLGQPTTPGLTAIDYRITDSSCDPPGTDGFSVEKLLRLDPCGVVFQPAPGTPDVLPPPSQRADSPTRGVITFGSFSNLSKLNDATFRAWAAILSAVPGSRLILRHAAMGSPGVKADLLRRLADAGLGDAAHARVEILGPVTGAGAMMPEYHRLDIALDTFPYAGMTTTCEALTMGVPVISMTGDRPVARSGAVILGNCGLADLVASAWAGYIRAALALAHDPARLAEIRASARERLARVVCNAPDFARRFELAMRGIWTDWCAAHPAG